MKIIDMDKIKDNYKKIKKEIYAVVKNDAYLLGIKEIVKLLISLGVKRFCVNKLEEGIELRKIDDTIYILLLSDFDVKKVELYKKYNITVTVSFVEKLKYVENLNYELKINFGLNRYGIEKKDYFYTDKPKYTHIGVKNVDLKMIKKYNILHYASSRHLSHDVTFFRVGMALYKDCLEVYEKVTNIRFLKKGEGVGYDYILRHDSYIAIINYGYCDGLNTLNKGRKVFINGKYYKIVSISMNHSFIIVDGNVKIGDNVELMGKNIQLKYLVKYLNMLEYEVFTSFRGKRIYKY